MKSIDHPYLQHELAERSASQLKQLFQNEAYSIIAAINKQLDDAEDDDDVIFTLSHSIKIDLSDMNIKGKLGFSVKRSTSLTTAINDPEQPQFDLGDGKRGNMGVAGEGDSGAVVDPGEEDEDDQDGVEFIPAGRNIYNLGSGPYCNRCGETFADEGKCQEHLDGPMCEDAGSSAS